MPNKAINSDFITESDLYKQYPYPCYDLTKSTIPNNPYIPKDKLVCDHKYTLTKKEWKLIFRTYLKFLKLYLLEGHIYKIPQRLGHFQIKKYKGRTVNTASFHEDKIRIHNNTALGGYKPILKWIRTTNACALSNKWFWKLRPVRAFTRQRWDYLEENFKRINNYIDD
jgi:hypothetical protein